MKADWTACDLVGYLVAELAGAWAAHWVQLKGKPKVLMRAAQKADELAALLAVLWVGPRDENSEVQLEMH